MKTPVFVHQGTDDPLVRWKVAEPFFKKFKDSERDFDVHLEPGLYHQIGRKGR